MSRLCIILFVAVAALAPAASAGPPMAAGPSPTVVAAPPLPGSDVFEPDVYPSNADAARGLGQVWAARADASWERPPARVRVYCCDPATYAAVREGIRSRLPDVPVHKAPADQCPDGFHGGEPAEGEVWCAVTAEAHDRVVAMWPGGTAVHKTDAGGTLSLLAKGRTDVAATSRYVDKPWLSNPAGFGRRGQRWVVGRTDPFKPAMSEAEATRAARRAATDEVVTLVRGRLGRAGRDEGWVRRRVEARLVAGRFEADRFPQRFDRGFGATWREAVLFDASDPNLSTLANELRAEHRAERRGFVMSFASAAGVLLVVYALYRLANAFTRGYFVWSLRTAAAVAATVVVVLILMIA